MELKLHGGGGEYLKRDGELKEMCLAVGVAQRWNICLAGPKPWVLSSRSKQCPSDKTGKTEKYDCEWENA